MNVGGTQNNVHGSINADGKAVNIMGQQMAGMWVSQDYLASPGIIQDPWNHPVARPADNPGRWILFWNPVWQNPGGFGTKINPKQAEISLIRQISSRSVQNLS